MLPLLPVPYLQQPHDGYCLPACVSMILNYWKIPLTQERVANLLGTTDVGTPISRVQRLTKHKLQVRYAAHGEWEDIQTAIAARLPVIVAVHAAWLPYSRIQSQHALVVIGCDEQTVFVLDPAANNEPIELSQNAFLTAWIEMECAYAIIKPI